MKKQKTLTLEELTVRLVRLENVVRPFLESHLLKLMAESKLTRTSKPKKIKSTRSLNLPSF